MSQTITEEIKPAYSNEFISLDEIFTELERVLQKNQHKAGFRETRPYFG